MYQITAHDGKIYSIAQTDSNRVKELAKRLDLVPVTLANGRIEYFSKGAVARISMTPKPRAESAPRLPDRREVDNIEDNEGLKKYKRVRERIFGSRKSDEV
jgi:hypothetical protein